MVLAREASQILGLYIRGEDFDGIERETGCSLSTIRAFLSGFDEEVLDTLRAFKNLSSEFDDVPEVLDALEGAKINRELEEFGLDRDDLQQYIDFCEKMADGSPEIIQEAVRFSELEEETGVPYDELVQEQRELADEVESLENDVERLRRKRSNLEEEVNDAERRLNERLEETRLSLERVEGVADLRKDLESRGMSLDDLGEIRDFYGACDEMGFDPKTVNNMVDLHSRLTKFGVDTKDISDFLRRNTKLDDLGFTLDAAAVLAERLDELGSDPVKAASQLTEIYDESRLVYNQLSELKRKREELREKTYDLEDMVTSLENEALSVKEEVEKLNDRRDQLMEREVQLKAEVDEKEEELRDIEKRISDLTESEELIGDVQALEERRDELKTIIEDLERERTDTPDPDLDQLYIKMKEQRDELFQACVDLFRESTNAWVVLAVEDTDYLDRLPDDSLSRLYKRIQVLKVQDDFGTLAPDTIEEAEDILRSRIEAEDPDAVEGLNEVEGFGDLGDLALI